MRRTAFATMAALGLSGDVAAEMDPGTTDAGFSVYAITEDDGSSIMGVMVVVGSTGLGGGWESASIYTRWYTPDSVVDLNKLMTHTSDLNMNNHSMCSGGSDGGWPSGSGDRFRLYRIADSSSTTLPNSSNQVYGCGPSDFYRYGGGDINTAQAHDPGTVTTPPEGQLYEVKLHQSSGASDFGYLKHKPSNPDKIRWFVLQS